MRAWPAHPAIYEISTWVWLQELGHRLGRPANLATVPTAEWDRVASLGFDAVWFMGVWERSGWPDNLSHMNILAWRWHLLRLQPAAEAPSPQPAPRGRGMGEGDTAD